MNDDAFVVHLAVPSQEARPLLRMPVMHATVFTSKPLKWLRYVTAAVLGAEGGLSTLDRRTLDLEDTQPDPRDLLYTPTESIRFIDTDGLDHIKSSQFTTESQLGFEDIIKIRDEHKCIISNHYHLLCEAAHLIPRSKGSNYIQALCRWRTRHDEPEIESITDIRNGIYVTTHIHAWLTAGQMAVLRTPNFAMTREDVLPAPIANQNDLPFHFTPHYFLFDDKAEYRDMYPRDCRYPPVDQEQDWPNEWPPASLWDFVYGVVISNQYGIGEAIDALNQEYTAEYYPEGIKTARQAAEMEIARRKSEHEKMVEDQNRDRDTRAANRGQRRLMDSFDRVFSSWMYYRFGPLGQKTRAEDEAKIAELERERQQAKANEIAKWREELEEGMATM